MAIKKPLPKQITLEPLKLKGRTFKFPPETVQLFEEYYAFCKYLHEQDPRRDARKDPFYEEEEFCLMAVLAMAEAEQKKRSGAFSRFRKERPDLPITGTQQ